MASSDPLDAFFKKIDRKGNKHKKQTTLLTNTEELHKQLVIVTSATSAFKENMDLDEEEDEHVEQVATPAVDAANLIEDGIKAPVHSSSTNTKTKSTGKLSVQDSNHNSNDQQMAGDEWEEFEDSASKYDKLRLKFSRPTNDDENDEEIYSDDENHLHHDQIDGNENRRREQQQQQQEKPVWKLEQLQQTAGSDLASDKAPEQPSSEPVKPVSTGAYRPPQLRGNSSVTIVSGGAAQRATKKEKPNLASTEEFPTLGAGAPKK